MWIGNDTTIELQRNARLSFSGAIFDAVEKEYVDISDMSISCAVAKVAGGDVIVNPAAVIDAPLGGGFTIEFVGSAFDTVEGVMEPVNLAYDVRIGDNVVMRGTLVLIPGVGE